MPGVFVSYSRKDMDFARKLAGDLEQAGYEVWWDISDLQGGDDWLRVIPAAIEAAQYFIVLLSPFSVESEWVKKEYLHALNKRLKIIPVMIAPCAVPFALATINYLDFTAYEAVTNLNRLLAALGYTGEPVKATLMDKKTWLPWPPALAKYEYPILGAGLLALVLILFFVFRALTPISPTPTPVVDHSPTPSVTHTTLPTETLTPTSPATFTPTATISLTPTQAITLTPTLTRETALRVELCVRTDFTTLVRIGPGKAYPALTNTLKGDDCLLFSARNAENTWYMIAPRQPDTRFREFEYGWVSNIALDLEQVGLLDLPVATPIPTVTRTAIPSSTATATSTETFTPTITPTRTPTETLIPTDTRVPTDTVEPTATP